MEMARTGFRELTWICGSKSTGCGCLAWEVQPGEETGRTLGSSPLPSPLLFTPFSSLSPPSPSSPLLPHFSFSVTILQHLFLGSQSAFLDLESMNCRICLCSCPSFPTQKKPLVTFQSQPRTKDTGFCLGDEINVISVKENSLYRGELKGRDGEVVLVLSEDCTPAILRPTEAPSQNQGAHRPPPRRSLRDPQMVLYRLTPREQQSLYCLLD